MAAPIQASSQGAPSEGTNPPALCRALSWQPLPSCCSLGRTKGEHVPKQGLCSSPSCHSLPQNSPENQEQQLSSGDAWQQSVSFHKKKKLKPFDSQHFLRAQANRLYTEESSFSRVGFLKCWGGKKKKKAQCFKLQNCGCNGGKTPSHSGPHLRHCPHNS